MLNRCMRQRGRRSAASLAVINVTGTPPRPSPPPGLTKAERTLFAELVAASKHLTESDSQLLVSFAQATLTAQRAARDPSKIDAWERAVRVQAMLATKLRLSPQSRTDPKTVGRGLQRVGPQPWEL